MKIFKQVDLTNTAHGHNKAYQVVLTLPPAGKGYLLCASWGKIGGKPQLRNEEFEDLPAAEKAFAALVASKKADGYKVPGEKVVEDPLGFYPMKADEEDPEVVEQMLDDPSIIGEQKYDGSRYTAKLYDMDRVLLHSRKMSVKNELPVDKTGNVPHIIEALKKALAVWKIGITGLDGEILWDAGSVISVMGALPAKAIARQKELGWVYFMVYDLPYCDGEPLFDEPFVDRRKALERLFKDMPATPHIRLAPQKQTGKRQWLKEIWDSGGEGMILKDPLGLYLPGERPRGNWVKVKAKKTDEFVIMGFVEGKGKYSGQVGAVIFGQHDRLGKLVEISQASGMSDEERLAITKKPKSYIGRVVEIEFQQRTPPLKDSPGGSLRHPRWVRLREDKSARECVIPKEH
jgi:bifunctional non-homologous end joining protein LigD